MQGNKSEILAQLKKEILPLQGYKPVTRLQASAMGLGPLLYAFPGAQFPLGAIHEFICNDNESLSATGAFVTGLSSSLVQNSGAVIWISAARKVFPPAIMNFGIDPSRIIFVDIRSQKDLLWSMEEALKCDGLAAVMAELPELDFTSSRRLQLAVEQSGVTGFIFRTRVRKLNTTASIARWRVEPVPSSFYNDMPGVAFPRWNVELLKVRNGKPGQWQLEWRGKQFRHIETGISTQTQLRRKTG